MSTDDRALNAALEQAKSFKDEGNKAFKEGKYVEAIRVYTNAIELDPDNAVLYSNRSAAYLAEGESRGKALKDAERCIELKPNWFKGYLRKGAAEHALKRFESSRATYYEGLKYDEENESLKTAIEDVRKAQNEHSKMLKEQAKRREELQRQLELKKKEKEQQEKEKESNEDELLAGFFSEVQDLEDQANCIKKPIEDTRRQPVQFGTSDSQINRLLQPHFEWINLNPFGVLQLETDATEEEIKQHYRKISALIHPDKCKHVRAREAFEEVKKANELLKKNDRRITCIQVIERARKKAEKDRKDKLKKGVPEAHLEDLSEMQKKEVMRSFAEIENRRRNLEKREAVHRKREADQQEKEQEKMVEDYKREKEWADVDKREKRVGSWRGFQTDGKKARTGVSGWKEERRDTETKIQDNSNDYKKKWR